MSQKISNPWSDLKDDLYCLFPRLIQPKFVFISLVTLSVSTCGIWIGPIFLEDNSQIGFSIFSFIIATLGVLAAENLLRNESSEISSYEKHRQQVKVSFSVLLWFFSFVFSFFGLTNQVNGYLFISLAFTVFLWLTITASKNDFDLPPVITPDSLVQDELNKFREEHEPGAGL